MNLGVYRASRKVYHSLSPRDRRGMTAARMVTLLARAGILTTADAFVSPNSL